MNLRSINDISVIKGDMIGSGSLGVVYHAEIEISREHEMHPILANHQWVFKEVPKKRFVASEPEIAARYSSVSSHLKNYQFSTLTTHYKTGWIAEYIPGKSFTYKNTADLSFKKLIRLVFELVVRTNLFHHHTIRGNAIVHGDINCANMHFNVYPDSNRLPDIEYFDYGMSFELTDDNPDLEKKNPSVPKKLRLNKNYFAPEAYKNHLFGIKTDIFMLADCIEDVLLGRLPVTKPDISKLILAFLRKAKSKQYKMRPDSDEFMKFFTLVNCFYKIPEFDIKSKNRVAAKLAVLFANKGDQKISVNDDMTWGQYYLHDVGDFGEYDNDIDITIRCITAYENMINWSEILNNPDFVTSIARLEKINMVDKTVIAFLFDNADICSQFAHGSLTVLPYLVDRDVKTLRKVAITQIEYRLRIAKTVSDVNAIADDLEKLAENNDINYLYARQGCPLSFNQHQWKNQDVSGTWVNIMKRIKKRKLQLAYSLIKFDEFQAAYNEKYKSELFKNPWSKMKKMLDCNLYHSMDEVFQHAINDPDSRTARVLKRLALTKADAVSLVEDKRNVI